MNIEFLIFGSLSLSKRVLLFSVIAFDTAQAAEKASSIIHYFGNFVVCCSLRWCF